MAYPVQTVESILSSWGMLSNLDYHEKQTLYQIFLVQVVNKHHYIGSENRNNCLGLYNTLKMYKEVSDIYSLFLEHGSDSMWKLVQITFFVTLIFMVSLVWSQTFYWKVSAILSFYSTFLMVSLT